MAITCCKKHVKVIAFLERDSILIGILDLVMDFIDEVFCFVSDGRGKDKQT